MVLIEILRMLLDVGASLLGAILLLRVCMNWIGIPARNPLAQFTLAMTDWLVVPLRKLIPPAGRVDMASLAGAYLAAAIELALVFLLIGAGVGDWPWVKFLLYAALQVLRWMLYLVMWLAIIHAMLGWINPHAPVAPVIGMLARPFLAPLQRVIPLIGGVDLSPLALVVLVNLVLLVVPRFGL